MYKQTISLVLSVYIIYISKSC